MTNEKQYSKISFFRVENEDRYNSYAALHGNMPLDEVVWRVNNNLDKKDYEQVEYVSDLDNPCVIVNKHFKLPEDYCPPDLVEADGRLMRAFVAEAYIKMRDAAAEEGFTISVTSAYRSGKDQQETYNKFLGRFSLPEIVDETVARPGHSEHQLGVAVDIQGSIPGGRNISKTPEAAWLKENCHKFGFILRYLPETVDITRYASEPWHCRYVGVDISTDMVEKNIKTLEEYSQRFVDRWGGKNE